MHTDRFGALWVATSGGLLRIDPGGRVTSLTSSPLLRISAITSDLQNGVWLADLDQGVLQLTDGRFTPLPLPSELQGVQVLASLGDRSGRVWFLFANGQVAVVDPDHAVHVYGEADGSDGVYRAIYEDDEQVIWLGGDHGLSRFDNGRFIPFGRSNGFPEGSVIGISRDRAGALWFGLEGIGLVRVPREELQQLSGDAFHRARYSFYDQSDGYAGTPRWFGNSSSAHSADGRLWFISLMGITIIDPDRLDRIDQTRAK